MPFSRDLPHAGIELRSPVLQADSLLPSHQGSPLQELLGTSMQPHISTFLSALGWFSPDLLSSPMLQIIGVALNPAVPYVGSPKQALPRGQPQLLELALHTVGMR